MSFGSKDGSHPRRSDAEARADPKLADPVIDDRRTAYPSLRHALTGHLCDVCEFVHLGQRDAARGSLRMAIAIQAELDADRWR
jgi:hypothetical protein